MEKALRDGACKGLGSNVFRILGIQAFRVDRFKLRAPQQEPQRKELLRNIAGVKGPKLKHAYKNLYGTLTSNTNLNTRPSSLSGTFQTSPARQG